MKNIFIFYLLCLCLSLPCYGQEGKMFTVDRELSSSMLNKIYQDRDGIIWIATEDGLNRYEQNVQFIEMKKIIRIPY